MLGVPIRRALSSAAGSAAGGVSRSGLRNVVLVDGARLPFQPAMSAYNDLISYDLARLAMTGLITKTGVSPKEVDYVLMGTVLQEVKTSNLARDAALASGFPKSVPAHTISQACISANQAICTGMSFIQTGQADVVLAGGVETFSDVPIRFSRPLRKALLATTKIKGGPMKKLKAFKGLKLSDLAPDQPAVANFITGEVMGHSSDRLAEKFGVTRKEQDEFALR
jgi:acetyl-CoA acyltransferase|tara:strand:+ start:170 stop:841 length:672 start_codon:yes stop_codon:yes gene_type:complete